MPLVTTLANTSARGYGGLKTFGVPSSYYSIQTATVDSGGSGGSITFSSIPSTYTHLQLRILARTARSDASIDAIKLQFNSDTASNYTQHELYGDGSGFEVNGNANQSAATFAYTSCSAALSNTFGVIVYDILDYANTNKYKTVRGLVGFDQNNNGLQRVGLDSGLWRSTSAISSITIVGHISSNFQQYSQFALYGIKA